MIRLEIDESWLVLAFGFLHLIVDDVEVAA